MLVPFFGDFCDRLRLLGPPGSLVGSLWSAGRHLAFLCLLGHLSGSLSVPLGGQGGQKGCFSTFFCIWVAFLRTWRHRHPSPRPKTSGIQDSKNLRFNYAVGPRFNDSVKHIFEDSWHAKVCEAWPPSVSETPLITHCVALALNANSVPCGDSPD